jgi:hypothetical protein
MGKHKYIESPEKMWALFEEYKLDVQENPFLVPDWVGKDATEVKRQHLRVLTMEGFECFVMDNSKITYPDLTVYFEGKNESYKDFFPVCSRIKREIRRDQIEKGLAGLANPSITQRLNGLVEKTLNENIHIEQPLFTDMRKNVRKDNSD